MDAGFVKDGSVANYRPQRWSCYAAVRWVAPHLGHLFQRPKQEYCNGQTQQGVKKNHRDGYYM